MLKKLLAEFFTVTIGILIALFINNWKQDYDNKKYMDRVLNSIENDIAESQASIDKIMPRHEALIDSVMHYLDDESISIQEITQQAGGVQYPFIKNIGLRFFISTKADLVDYDIISDLTEMEDSKKLLEKKFDKLMDYVYEAMGNTDRESKIMYIIHLSNVIDSESSLVEQFESYLSSQAQLGEPGS